MFTAVLSISSNKWNNLGFIQPVNERTNCDMSKKGTIIQQLKKNSGESFLVLECEEVLKRQHKKRCRYVKRAQKQHLMAQGVMICATK